MGRVMFHKGKPVIIITIMLLALILMGISNRLHVTRNLRDDIRHDAIPLVATIDAKANVEYQEFMLPGNVTAWHETTIFARTNGYVKRWLVDIGSIVKEGDLLAEIDIPDVEAQLRRAEADLKTSIENYHLAKTTALRWINLLKTNSVSKQETDEKISAAASLRSVVNASRAQRDTLRDQVNFKNIIAPFDGIISDRTTDLGTLINEGNTTAIRPLFQIVQANKLRVYVKVPQNVSALIQPCIKARLSFPQHPGKIFLAKLSRTAGAIDPLTRTLMIEFEVDNPEYILLPGGYTQIKLAIPTFKGSVLLPVNTLIFRENGLQIATLNQNNQVTLQSIQIARDFGTDVEINSGVKVGEKIVINPPDSLTTGMTVRLVNPGPSSEKKTT